MESEKIKALLQNQSRFFDSGKTLDPIYRIAALKKLYAVIRKRETEITEALEKDLGKSGFEGYMCEIGLALSEIRYMIRHTRHLAAERTVHTPLSQMAARSYEKPGPYGNVLVMSPWNYPFLLSVDPVADAIAAGNTVILKPSAYAPATAAAVKLILEEVFDPEYVAVVTGGREENARLLEEKFDMVFFTGSQAVGREVLRHTAETLTPAVLELGGKSPCIVDNTADLKLAARRIVFGKFLNCGQTCVAPDYILCDISVKDTLIQEIRKEIVRQFGENPLENQNYGKIINQKHFHRLTGLLDQKKLVFGGDIEESSLRIAPAVLDRVSWDDPVMQEEIFGPILPILTFTEFHDIFGILRSRPKPLALYLFSQNRTHMDEITEQCRFGGGCLNDTVIHLATPHMGFGGVGESGMGAYHGKEGFLAFSHKKRIVDKKTWMDLPIRYQPYTKKFERMLRLFLR